MLKRQFRLPVTRATFAQRIHTPFYTVKFASNGLAYNRFGFVVSKQVDKKAVIRNLVKRKLRSCIEKRLDQIHPGHDFLFILKKEAVGKETDTLCVDIQGMLQQHHLI